MGSGAILNVRLLLPQGFPVRPGMTSCLAEAYCELWDRHRRGPVLRNSSLGLGERHLTRAYEFVEFVLDFIFSLGHGNRLGPEVSNVVG